MSPTTLAGAPAGAATVISAVDGPQALVRRLAELGIRRAAVVVPMHRTAGGGRVIDVAGSRIALAPAVLGAILTEATP